MLQAKHQPEQRLRTAELQRGEYELSIDVVKEGQFWLADKGATATVIPVVIA